MQTIIDYIMTAYQPLAIIFYGSYADGTQGEGSDFDALVIAPGEARHDNACIGGVTLDVFIQPPEAFEGNYDACNFVQLFDGKILLDTDGLAARLVERVQTWVRALPAKSAQEIDQSLSWCLKMLRRAERADAEGLYRMHWLLIESLEIYCDSRALPYFGPKKALKRMQTGDPKAFACYERALREGSLDALKAWIEQLTASQNKKTPT